MAYTAMSRTPKLSGLFIKGTFKKFPPILEESSVMKEMRRMKTTNPYVLCSNFPDNNQTIANTNIRVCYHNIRSLNKYINYVQSDVMYTKFDVLIFSETRTKRDTDISLSSYTIVHRLDGEADSNHAYGMHIYSNMFQKYFIQKTNIQIAITLIT